MVRTEPLTLAPSPRLEVSRVFQPGAIARHFVKVPQGATWACFKARNLCKDTAGKFILHTIQLLPSSMVKTMEHYKMFNLAEDGSWEFGLPVRSGPGAVACRRARSVCSGAAEPAVRHRGAGARARAGTRASISTCDKLHI